MRYAQGWTAALIFPALVGCHLAPNKGGGQDAAAAYQDLSTAVAVLQAETRLSAVQLAADHRDQMLVLSGIQANAPETLEYEGVRAADGRFWVQTQECSSPEETDDGYIVVTSTKPESLGRQYIASKAVFGASYGKITARLFRGRGKN